MKQLLQNLKNGDIDVIDSPTPALKPAHILIRTAHSLISAGTERMLRDFGRANLLQKAIQQPERVRDVLAKMGTDGLSATLQSVNAKLDQPISIGYCNVGRIIEVPQGESEFRIGDRVLSNGSHAEIVQVPKRLVARIPENVSDEAASFAVLGAIALQGIRLAELELGACAAVTGLGLVGLLAVQLLRAQGTRVLGIDPDPDRCALARLFGADTVCLSRGEDPLQRAADFSRGRGMDAVLITASTKSNEPIMQAAQMARQKGTVVLVGVTGLNIPRSDFYRKELVFHVSCSYGPGRYDPAYEEDGHDYPVGYVRWTAQRNFEAVLDIMAAGNINVAPLLSMRVPIADATRAYHQLDEGGKVLGILLDYPGEGVISTQELSRRTIDCTSATRPLPAAGAPRIGVIGAGNYATRQLMPVLRSAGGRLVAVAGSGGLSAAIAARRFCFLRATSDHESILNADDIDLVVIATRHDSHGVLAAKALSAGKAVFVEKPLALTMEELTSIASIYERAPAPFLMVGYNRRFAPLTQHVKRSLAAMGAPAAILMTINAGAIPSTHWTQDRKSGGGRIMGEACHFVDLARYLAGAPISKADVLGLGAGSGDANPEDKALIQLGFTNGTVASIHYLANGSARFPKERIEIFCAGRVWQIDNFRRLNGFGVKSAKIGLFGTQDKGQSAMGKAVITSLTNGMTAPIPFDELFEVARVVIELDQRLRKMR